MYATLAVIMLAVACFTVLVLRRTGGRQDVGRAQLESFGYLGAGALALAAAAVFVLGLAGVSGGKPELVAIIGLFVFVVYLGIAYAVAHLVVKSR